jgi:hypothetical protein
MVRRAKEESDQLRAALRRFLKFKKFSVAEWARHAEISEGTLRNFLAGTSETLTHATLAALARAVDQPIGAIIGEIPLQGYSDNILVRYEVDAKKTSDSRSMLLENQFYISLPVDLRFPNVDRFGAIIKDESAHEFYPRSSIVICVDYVAIDRVPNDGDRVLVVETQSENISGKPTESSARSDIFRVTVREINIPEPGVFWLTFPASHRKFVPDGLPMLRLSGELTKIAGLGGYRHYAFEDETTLVTSIEGLIVASYSLEEYRS